MDEVMAMEAPKCRPHPVSLSDLCRSICTPFLTSGDDARSRHIDRLVYRYLQRNPPSLSAVYYDNPGRQTDQQIEWIKWHEREWPLILEMIAGPGNICFISDWALPGSMTGDMPPGYTGQLVAMPGKPSFYELVVNELHIGDAFACLWGFQSWGYVLPQRLRAKLPEWLSIDTITQAHVADLFESIELMFWVDAHLWEVDGVVVLSHKHTADEVCRRVRKGWELLK